MFILRVNLGMWPLNSIFLEIWALLCRVSTHIYGVSKEKDGKPFIFPEVKIGMLTPQINLLGKMRPVLRVSTHIYGVSKEIDGKIFIFRVKPGMLTPQMNRLRKTSPVLKVSTHIYGVSKEIDGKMFIFQVNQGMWPSNRMSWKIKPWFEGFKIHIWGFQGDRWETIHFESKHRHVTPQINHLGKLSAVLSISTHIYGVSMEIDEKMFILRVHLGMWPFKLIFLEKWDLFWWFQHTFMGFPRI